jgi:hypothetical protein
MKEALLVYITLSYKYKSPRKIPQRKEKREERIKPMMDKRSSTNAWMGYRDQ